LLAKKIKDKEIDTILESSNELSTSYNPIIGNADPSNSKKPMI